MNKHLLARGFSALLVASMGTAVTAQEDEERTEDGERRVRIEITKNENGKKSHVTREFDLNNDEELHDALRELGVIDELSTIGNGENLVLDLRRITEGGLLNDMCMALSMPDLPSPPDVEEMRQAYLGVYYDTYSKENATGKDQPPVRSGSRITRVEEGSAAEKAGLQEGDVVVQIGDDKIEEGDDLAEAISTHKPGDEVKITFYRGKQKKTVGAVLGEREDPYTVWNWNGADLAPYLRFDDDSAADWEAYFGDDAEREDQAFLGVVGGSTEDGRPGVRIGEVVDGSAAEQMGLQEGDVLRRLNGEELEDFGDLTDGIDDLKPGDPVEIELLRDDKPMTLKGELGKRVTRTWSWNGTAPAPPMPPASPTPPGVQRYQDRQAWADEARARADEARAQADEMRAQMDELRSEMDRLRQELRGDITREMRVSINTMELSPEEKLLLKSKGVAGFDQPLELNDLRCFPNPSEGSFHLMFQVPERGDLSVDVHDATGERVYHEVITGFKGNYDRTLDLSDKPAGNYFVVIGQNGRLQSRKLVKK